MYRKNSWQIFQRPDACYTSTEILDTKEKFDIKKDIFMYSKFRNDQLMYLGTEVTEKCDLRSLKNYEILLKEFRQMVTTLTGSEQTLN